MPLDPAWEYAVVVLRGAVGIAGTGTVQSLRPGALGYLGRGRDEVRLEVREPTTALLLGGQPWAEDPLVMWWNFVARSRAEVEAAYTSWDRREDRFGRVTSSLPLIPAQAPSWLNGRHG